MLKKTDQASVLNVPHSAAPSWLSTESACGQLIAERDWSATPLGPIAGWPQSLRTALGMVLSSPLPIVMLWGDEGVMLYNDGYSVFAGGRHPELLGSKVREGWPEVADFNDHVMKVGLAGGTLSYKDQELTLHRNGEPEQVVMNLDYSPVPGEDGRPAGVLAIVIETTERLAAQRLQTQAEEALTLERDRSQGVLQNMAEGFVLLDRNFRVLDINAEGLRMEQRPRSEIVGKIHWEAWPGTEDSELGRLYKKAMADQTPLTFEHEYVWPDGHRYWIETRGYPTAGGLALFHRDVSDRHASDVALRAATEAARKEAAKGSAILAQLAEGVIVTDRDGRITFVNEAAKALHGVETLDVEPADYSQIYHLFREDGTPYPFEELPLARAVKNGEIVLDARWRIRRPDGTEVLAIGGARPIVDPDLGQIGSVLTVRDDTARSAGELAVRESESRFRNMADHAPVMMWVTDADGYCTYLNRGWYEFTGQSEAEGEGFGWLEAVHPDDRGWSGEAFRKANEAREPFRIEYRLRRHDGVYCWAIDAAAPRFGPDGEYLGYVGSVVDIDERQRAEALKSSQNRLLELAVTDAPLDHLLELLVKAVEDESRSGMLGSILLMDEGGKHLRHGAAPSLPEDYNGAIDGIAIGPSVGSCGTAAFTRKAVFVSDIASDPLWADFKELALGHGLRACWSTPILSASGTLLGTFAMYYPEPREPNSSDLEMVGFVSRTASLIIERKRAEEALKEESRRLRLQGEEFQTLAENMPALCWMAQADGHIFWYNQRWYEYTGTTPESQEGWGWESVHDPECLPAVAERWRHSLDTGTPFEMVFPLKGADGLFRPFLTRIVPVRDEMNTIIRWFGTNVDISEQQAAEAALAEALKTSDVLLHEVNHRVKNSLQVVTGLLMLQASQASDPDLRQALLEARGRIAVVASMHQRLYSTSQHDRVDFGDYIRELTEETLASLGGEGRIALESNIQPGIMVLLQQAVPLALVVSELVTNAVKYAFPDHRRGQIGLKLQRVGDQIVLQVSDDGVGLPPDFDPAARKGLGMRIVTSLVKQVRGKLNVGRTDPGASFRIDIPADRID